MSSVQGFFSFLLALVWLHIVRSVDVVVVGRADVWSRQPSDETIEENSLALRLHADGSFLLPDFILSALSRPVANSDTKLIRTITLTQQG